jgi:hypothetical protein
VPKKPTPPEYSATMTRGLQSLYRLSLDFTPGGDELGQLTELWADDTWAVLESKKPTKARVEAAFQVLRVTCARWPTPREFLDAYMRTAGVPSAPYHAKDPPRALPKPRTLSESSAEEIRKLCERVGAKLHIDAARKPE